MLDCDLHFKAFWKTGNKEKKEVIQGDCETSLPRGKHKSLSFIFSNKKLFESKFIGQDWAFLAGYNYFLELSRKLDSISSKTDQNEN